MRIGLRNGRTVLFLALACFGRWEVVAVKGADEHAGPIAVELVGTPTEIGERWGAINRQAVRSAVGRYVAKAKKEKLAETTLLERAQPCLEIVQQVAPHWIEAARAIAQAAEVDADLYLSFLANSPRGLGFHECTSYAVTGKHAEAGGIFFHKNRDNVDREQAAYILTSSVRGVNKFIAISNASGNGCSMMVNDKGLAGSGDYPAHLTRKGDPDALLPEPAEPQFRGMMSGSILRYIAERAVDCGQALSIIEEFVERGYYAGGTVNGTHWLFVDRAGTILEVSSNVRHVASRIHTQKAYFSRLDGSAAAKTLRQAEVPIGFHRFHNASRDPSICLASSIAGMTVEIDAEHPEVLTCAWISLPARSLSYPVFMGAHTTPRCLLSGNLYRVGKLLAPRKSQWETLEEQTHAEKQRLAEKAGGLLKAGQTAEAVNMVDAWTKATADAQLANLKGLVPAP